MGFDDIRRFNTLNRAVMPIYALPEVLEEVQRIFHYVGETAASGLYRPLAAFRPVAGAFEIGGAVVTPVPVTHGNSTVCGWRVDCGGRSLGYVPDCAAMPEEAFAQLAGVDVMVLDALRDRPHVTHMTVDASLAALARINAERSYLIHMCHDLEHGALQSRLPKNVFVSYDGLRISI
jgi:phosphoribosyl 1,2-cyclic phosphate phosphodiesterase